jgi:hypothetical protein
VLLPLEARHHLKSSRQFSTQTKINRRQCSSNTKRSSQFPTITAIARNAAWLQKKSRQMKFFGAYFSRLPYIGAHGAPGGIGAQREPHPHAGKPSEADHCLTVRQ